MRRLSSCFSGLLCWLVASQLAFGQASRPAADSTRHKVYTYTERLPVFPAREAADSTRNTFQRLKRFLEQDKMFPPKALRDGVQGQVKFSFAVDAQGRTTDIKLVQGLRADVDSAVLRNARRLEAVQWRPGTQNGRPVRVAYTVPLTFSVGNVRRNGEPFDSLDTGPYQKLVLPLGSWSGQLARLPAGKGFIYGSCLQRLGTNGLGMGQYVRLVNLTTHKAVRLNVKPILKSRRENAFCYALPAGRYALFIYEYPDPVLGAFSLHFESLRKPLASQPTAGLGATRYLFTVAAGQLHYVGTWNLANEHEPIFLDEKALLDAALQPELPGLPLETARVTIPR